MNQEETLQRLLSRAETLIRLADHFGKNPFPNRLPLIKKPKSNKPQDEILVIKATVCEVFGNVTIAEMDSSRRPDRICIPRMIAMELCTIFTEESLSEIGKSFGGKDHGTVMHARDRVSILISVDIPLRNKYRACEKLVKEKLAPREPEYYV